MATNKNSVYVQSLVDFILDTKPYHSKIDSVIEEYRFSESMTVNFTERTYLNGMFKSAWTYPYFSGGTGTNQQILTHYVQGPRRTASSFMVGQDENTDLTLVPRAFDPKSFQGPGIARALYKRGSGALEPVIEGIDVFQSHGAYTFKIFQTVSTHPIVVGHFEQSYTVDDGPFPKTVILPFTADSLVLAGPVTQISTSAISVTGPGTVHVDGISNALPYSPTFAEKRNENVLSTATAAVQALALDATNPHSCISKTRDLLEQISAHLSLHPNPAAQAEVSALLSTISTGNIPSSYEALLNELVNGNTPVLTGYPGWVVDLSTWQSPYSSYVDQVLASYRPAIFANEFTDVGNRESGALRYENISDSKLLITDITVDPTRVDYEEFTVVYSSLNTFLVYGTSSAFIGSGTIPGTFTSPQVSFKTAFGTVPLEIGDTFTLTPAGAVSIHPTAPLETWTIIKVNPQAYNRPAFSSTRYGRIFSQDGTPDYVTVLDTTLGTGTIVLRATGPGNFVLTSTADSSYTANVPVNVPFNDGKLAFTINTGSAYTFVAGDAFYIELFNAEAKAEDLDLFYGFDMGPYDANEMVYNTVNSALDDYLVKLGFGYDSRFTNYDLVGFNLQVSQTAVSGRQWRLRALPDTNRPLNLQNSTVTNQVNLLAEDDPLNPNAATKFDMDSNAPDGAKSEIDADALPDLALWYSTQFSLEYYDNGWVQVQTLNVGDSYNSGLYGISFNLVPASKPFIAAQLTSTQYNGSFNTEMTYGGDTISWTVINEPPVQQGPACLSSINVPNLWLHGDSFHDCIAAQWTLTAISSTQYRVQGVYTDGDLRGQFVYPSPGLVVSLLDGDSFKSSTFGVHWTLYKGAAGLAAGDTFTFSTFTQKPTYKVFGTVSGWAKDATPGEWYWNGSIGFKIEKPVPTLFEAGLKLDDFNTSLGQVTLDFLRVDAPSVVYTIRSHSTGHWSLYRAGKIVSDGTSSVSDEYISLTLPPAVQGTVLVLEIKADTHQLSMGHDLVIAKSTAGRELKYGDSLVVYKTEFDDVQFSIKPKDSAHSVLLQGLGPQTVDLRFVDLNATSGVPLSGTSPETAVLQGWLPLIKERFDGATEAVFSDSQTKVRLRAAGTGETIGTIESLGTNPIEPVALKLDDAFAAKYLPLNTEATLVTLGGGYDDQVQVHISEGIWFLLSAGGLSNSTMFADVLSVNVQDLSLLRIKDTYANEFSVSIQDSPFGGFLPGYDNTLYDEEIPDGYYDAGQPSQAAFVRAKELMLLTRTPAQEDEYQNLLGLLGDFIDGTLENTTIEFFENKLAADDPVNTGGAFGFGTPIRGMSMSINQGSTGVAGAAVVEAMSVLATDSPTSYDTFRYDTASLDTPGALTALLYTADLNGSVRVASTGNRALAGLASIDGVSLVSGDKVLLKNQTDPSQNGVWIAAPGSWTRSSVPLVLNSCFGVLEGTAHAGTVWQVTTAPSTVNVDPVQFAAVTAYADFVAELGGVAGQNVQVNLPVDTSSLKVYVWTPAMSAPQPVILDKTSSRSFEFSLPSSTEFKLIAG